MPSILYRREGNNSNGVYSYYLAMYTGVLSHLYKVIKQMDTNNIQQLNSILDKHNECKNLLQQEYLTGKIDCKTNGHIKASLASILSRIPKDKFESLRRELYDLFSIIKM